MKLSFGRERHGVAIGPAGDKWGFINKPVFSFAYDMMTCSDDAGLFGGVLMLGGVVRELDQAELNEVAVYLGAAPNGGSTVVHGVDANGVYMGLVAPELAPQIASKAPAGAAAGFRWVEVSGKGGWRRHESVEAIKFKALTELDQTAGEVRMRFITEAPGQQGAYIVKAQQAQAFKEGGYAGVVPPYVAAEADALGATGADAADYILGVAHQFNNVLGPEIERLRRKGKVLVEAATTSEDATAVADSYLAQLRAIGA